jgi:hypothetical protein
MMLSRPKRYQRNRTSDQSGDDGNQTFGAVIEDGEVFELTPGWTGNRHYGNYPRHGRLRSGYEPSFACWRLRSPAACRFRLPIELVG